MYRDAEHGEEDGQLEEHGVDQDAGGLVVEDPDRPLQQRSVTVGVLVLSPHWSFKRRLLEGSRLLALSHLRHY